MHRFVSNKEITEKINDRQMGEQCHATDCIETTATQIKSTTHISWKTWSKIDLDEFIKTPQITVDQMIEDEGMLVVEGTITGTKHTGEEYFARYCDVFEIQQSSLREISSFILEEREEEGGIQDKD